MTLLEKASQIAKFEDKEKIGNKLFRFTEPTYEARFEKAISYLSKAQPAQVQNRGKREKVKNNEPTLKQWDFLQRNKVDTGCENYIEFCEKFTKQKASILIGRIIEEKEDGYNIH